MARLGFLAVIFLAAVSAGPPAASADQPKEDDRLKQLEKRVANLEREVADLRAQLKLPPKPALDNKLIGSWSVVKPGEVGVTGLRLELDGTFRMPLKEGGERYLYQGKYQVAGKVVALEGPWWKNTSGTVKVMVEVVSVGEKELVIRCKLIDMDKELEYKLERQ